MAAAVHSLPSFDSNPIDHRCEALMNITHRSHLQREHFGEELAHGGDGDEYYLGSLDCQEPPVFREVPVPADYLPYLSKSCFKNRIGIFKVTHRVIEFLVRPKASFFVHDVRRLIFPCDSHDLAVGTDQSRAVVEEPGLHLLIDSSEHVNSVLLGFARNSVDGWARDGLRFSEVFSVDILREVNGVEEFRKTDNVGVTFFYGPIDHLLRFGNIRFFIVFHAHLNQGENWLALFLQLMVSSQKLAF